MSIRNNVIWSDGLFIKPQHFQQQQRYFEYLTRFRSDTIDAHQSGFSKLIINQENLLHSKISIDEARGIFSDGTMFHFPAEGPPPAVIDLSTRSVQGQRIYLALPLRANGLPEIEAEGMEQDSVRMMPYTQEVRDNSSGELESHDVEVAQYRFRIMLEKEDRSSFACLPIARIVERKADGSIKLDDSFMPMAHTLEAVPMVLRWLDDFSGLMRARATEISQRLGGLGQSGVSGVSDFLMLQTLNRLAPLFRFLSTTTGIHPKAAYVAMAQAAGELATFTHEARMAGEWTAYNHEDLHLCLTPLERSLRGSLSQILEPNAVMLPLETHKFGVRTARLNDSSLINSSVFIVAVKASVPLEKLARDFPAQTKISSIEKIRDLISLHLPGIPLQPLPSVPRQLPYHAGFTYFQLDSSSPSWAMLKNSSGFAFHIAGEFPGLELNFWAIRS